MSPTKEDYWRAIVSPRAAYYGWLGKGPKEAYRRMWPLRIVFIVIWATVFLYLLKTNGVL